MTTEPNINCQTKLFSSNHSLSVIAFLFALIGLVQSIYLQDFIWFSRIGSMVVGVGIVLLARPSIVNEDLLPNVQSADTLFNLNSQEHFKALGETVPDYVINDLASRNAIGVIGPIITLLGTFIWGYGDLFNHFIAKHNCLLLIS